MQSTHFIHEALTFIEGQVHDVLANSTMGMQAKDDAMLALLQQKRVLTQTLEDLTYLLANPPKSGVCKSGEIRRTQEV